MIGSSQQAAEITHNIRMLTGQIVIFARVLSQIVQPQWTLPRLLHTLPISAANRFGVGSDEPHSVTFKSAIFDKRHRRIQSRLSAEGGKDGINARADFQFLLDDLADGLGVDGLDVGAIREGRIGHPVWPVRAGFAVSRVRIPAGRAWCGNGR